MQLAGLSVLDRAEATSWAARALSEAGPRGQGSLLGCWCENGPRGKVWAELFGLEEEVGPAGLVSGFWGFGLLLFLFLFLTTQTI